MSPLMRKKPLIEILKIKKVKKRKKKKEKRKKKKEAIQKKKKNQGWLVHPKRFLVSRVANPPPLFFFSHILVFGFFFFFNLKEYFCLIKKKLWSFLSLCWPWGTLLLFGSSGDIDN